MVRILSQATARIYMDNVDPGISESNAEQWNFWGNTSSLQAFFCTNPTAGLQTWERILFNGSSASLVLTLAGNLNGDGYDISDIINYTGGSPASTLRTGTTNTDSLAIQAYDVDGASYSTFITLSAADIPTCDLDDAVTKAGQYIYRAGGTDVAVSDGGSGASTLTGILTGNGTSSFTASTVTENGVLYGGASNAVSSLAVAATGTVLTGNTGAAPSFSASPSVTSITIGTPTITSGSGAPGGSAPQGSLYLRTDGSAGNNRAYINTDGATAWTPILTST